MAGTVQISTPRVFSSMPVKARLAILMVRQRFRIHWVVRSTPSRQCQLRVLAIKKVQRLRLGATLARCCLAIPQIERLKARTKSLINAGSVSAVASALEQHADAGHAELRDSWPTRRDSGYIKPPELAAQGLWFRGDQQSMLTSLQTKAALLAVITKSRNEAQVKSAKAILRSRAVFQP